MANGARFCVGFGGAQYDVGVGKENIETGFVGGLNTDAEASGECACEVVRVSVLCGCGGRKMCDSLTTVSCVLYGFVCIDSSCSWSSSSTVRCSHLNHRSVKQPQLRDVPIHQFFFDVRVTRSICSIDNSTNPSSCIPSCSWRTLVALTYHCHWEPGTPLLYFRSFAALFRSLLAVRSCDCCNLSK